MKSLLSQPLLKLRSHRTRKQRLLLPQVHLLIWTLKLHWNQLLLPVTLKVSIVLLRVVTLLKVPTAMDVLVTFTILLIKFWNNFSKLSKKLRWALTIWTNSSRNSKPRCANISLNNQLVLSKSIASLLMVLKNSDSQMMHFLWTLDRHLSEPVYQTTRLLLANSGNKPVSASLQLIAHSIMEKKIVAVL